MIYRREDVHQLGSSCLQEEVAGDRLLRSGDDVDGMVFRLL